MSHGYQAVLWNKNKRNYDIAIGLGIVAYIATFFAVSAMTWPGPNAMSPEILLIQAFGSCAFIMLTIILSIGPLARLSSMFNPLLYNRRHFGVMFFVVALVHVVIATFWYHGFGIVNPLVSILSMNSEYDRIAQFPFESLGFVALLILFVMAATSHDFWLANLKPSVWKAMHMLVYVAYGLLVLHIVLGALQGDRSSFYTYLVFASTIWLTALHILTGFREASKDSSGALGSRDDAKWMAVAAVADIPEDRARIIPLKDGERIAVFKYDGKISAVSNVCAHQNGPLGEGKIVDGCITCPWHGYQYNPDNGQSPPPFTEKIPTYKVKVEGDHVFVDPTPLPPGTPVEPALVSGSA